MNIHHPLFDGAILGAHHGIPDAVYHARGLGIVSKGALDALSRSPLHYLTWLTEPDEDTPALAFGRAFHCALLEPEKFVDTYTIEPDFGDCRKTDRTTKEEAKDNKTRRNEWLAANEGKLFLPDGAAEAIPAMVEAVRKHELARLILQDGQPEVSLTWQDTETGLRCKARPDYLVPSRRMCVDFKTTQDASEEHFARDCAKYRYHVQDALYRAGCDAAGQPVEHFLFVAVEKAKPYAVNVHTLDQDAIGRGHHRARVEMELLADCLKRDEFPGYPPHIHTISLPPWAA